MSDRAAIDVGLDEHREFRAQWRRLKIQWRDDSPRSGRHRRFLRAHVIDQATELIDAGDTDADVITDKIAGNPLTTFIITEAVKLLIKLIVQFILKRRGLLPEESGVTDG